MKFARLIAHRQVTRVTTALAFAAAVVGGCVDSNGLSDAKCLASCNGVCVDTQHDLANCGACGNVCAAGQACLAGTCATCEASTPDACGPVASAGGDGGASKTVALLAGQAGSFGNIDGTASAARFNGPWDVRKSGNDLFVADSNNCVIRKVDLATGTTSTFVGFMNDCSDLDGVGSAARLNGPTAAVLDGTGNMFVVERGGCLVRKIALATATVTTVTGTTCGYADGARTQAQFSGPQGLAYDGSANLYVSDSGNHAIRRVAIASGAVATVAGAPPPTSAPGAVDDVGGAARFSAPQEIYVDKSATYLYVADFNNHALRRVTLADGTVATVVGTMGQAGSTNGTGTAARLHSPVGLGFDGTNKLYLTEDFNQDIRVVSLTDFSVTSNVGAAGTGGYADGVGTGALLLSPRGPEFDGAGNYYVGDSGNHVIRKVVAATGTVTTVAGLGAAFGSIDGVGAAASFNYPNSLAYDGKDTIYVADYASSTIRSVSLSTGTVATVAGSAGVTGSVDGAGSAARFSSPSGVAVDADGNLYVADRENHTIRKIVVATRAVTTLAGSAGNPGYQEGKGSGALLAHPVALAFDGGKLYVAELDNHVVRVVPVDGSATSTLAGAPPPPGPPLPGSNVPLDGVGTNARLVNVSGIAAKDGTVYIADTNRIRAIDLATATVTSISGGGGYSDGVGVFANFSFNGQPGQLAVDADGNVLIADFYNGLIRSFSPKTKRSATVAGVYGLYGSVLGPTPTSITTSPRAVVAIPNGVAFAANYGVFTVR